MASCSYPDVCSWVQNLPPIHQWKTNSMSTCICSSPSSYPSLNVCVTKNIQSSTLTFSIIANFNLAITLWVSKPLKIKTNPNTSKFLDEETISSLTINFIQDVLNYGSNKNNSSYIRFPKLESISGFKEIFNLAFITLALLICIYEAPADLRVGCLMTLKNELIDCRLRAASTQLMKLLGSNMEEQWMRSVNLAITNWIAETHATKRTHNLNTPSPLFSYAVSTSGLWKVQLYCPVIAMDVEKSSNSSVDEKLLFSLNYHQLEGVIQFNYKVNIREKWVNVMVNTDNIR